MEEHDREMSEESASFCSIVWFNLVDLETQVEAVQHLLQGFTRGQKLAWLRQHGDVTPAYHPQGESLYTFVSPLGIRTQFWLTETGELVVPKENRETETSKERGSRE